MANGAPLTIPTSQGLRDRTAGQIMLRTEHSVTQISLVTCVTVIHACTPRRVRARKGVYARDDAGEALTCRDAGDNFARGSSSHLFDTLNHGYTLWKLTPETVEKQMNRVREKT